MLLNIILSNNVVAKQPKTHVATAFHLYLSMIFPCKYYISACMLECHIGMILL